MRKAIATIEVFSWHRFYGGTPQYCVRTWRNSPYRSEILDERWTGCYHEVITVGQTIADFFGHRLDVNDAVHVSNRYPDGGNQSEMDMISIDAKRGSNGGSMA